MVYLSLHMIYTVNRMNNKQLTKNKVPCKTCLNGLLTATLKQPFVIEYTLQILPYKRYQCSYCRDTCYMVDPLWLSTKKAQFQSDFVNLLSQKIKADK